MMSGGDHSDDFHLTNNEYERQSVECSVDSPTPYYSTPSSSSGLGSGGSAYGSSSSTSNNNPTESNTYEPEHIYEDINITHQKLPKISASLNKDKTAVVRPVAFKPISATTPLCPTSHRMSTPINLPGRTFTQHDSTDSQRAPSLVMTHTGSLKLSLLRNSQFSLSQNSLCFDNCDNQCGGNGDDYLKSPLLSSADNNLLLNSNMSESYLNLADFERQTPSPSDSGIAELEAMIKEKDSEINFLRDTLEQNEKVIFKVYEEKQHNWKKELEKIRGQYENRLKMCQQRALKMEQLLMNQSHQLQQEKKKLNCTYDRIKKDKEYVSKHTCTMKQEIESLKMQLDETRWSLCQKNGEISLMKSQLKDSQTDQSNKASEIVSLRNQLKDIRAETAEKNVRISDLELESSRKQREVEDSKSRLEQCLRDLKLTMSANNNNKNNISYERNTWMADMQMENERLRILLADAKRAIDYEKGSHENERINWLEEKEKVIRYQKQLQLNYVQMFRRNHSLEREVEQLTIELEHRDYRTIGESNC